MSVISKKNNFLGTSTAAILVFLATVLFRAQDHSVSGVITITVREEKCLEKTGALFEQAGEDLLTARQSFTQAMDMKMTSDEKMSATYPKEELDNYDTYCTKHGGKMHWIKVDFFDCRMIGSKDDVELTLRNFANCMADVEECNGFGQEHLLQEAWQEMGLFCELEDHETKKDPIKPDNNNVDDDLAKREKEEKEAAAKGADEVDKEEKNSEYVPKEKIGKNGKEKKKGGFMKFLLFVSLCGAGYFVYDRQRRGLPIELPAAISSRLPFGGPSRFARRPQTGFVSDYNLLSAEENTLQFSSNVA